MHPDYVTAVETRLQWLRWMRTQESFEVFRKDFAVLKRSDVEEMQLAHTSYRHALETATTFVMAPEFCRLVAHAAAAVPLDLAFDPAWPQVSHGWLWISEPPLIPEIEGQDHHMPIHLRAVSWAPIPTGMGVKNAFGVRSAESGWLHACMFVTAPRYEHFLPWSYPVMRPGATLQERIAEFEADAKERDRRSAYKASPPYSKEALPVSVNEIAWFYVAQHLMAQRLATTLRVPTDRATRRRAVARNEVAPEDIAVVTLRRLEAARQRDPAGNVVDWQWQWKVIGHWRWQYFPSENRHKRVFIAEYWKGPEDKPRKPASTKLFVARR